MADLSYEELLNLIQRNHPQIWVLLDKPGIRDLALQIVQAEANGNPWTDQQILDSLHATPYYQSTPQTQRDVDIQAATDPASSRQYGDMMSNRVISVAESLGIHLSPVEQWDTVGAAVANGWDAAAIRHNLLFRAAFGPTDSYQPTTGYGEIAGNSQQVQALASQYAIPMSEYTAQRWAIGMADGAVDEQGLRSYMVEQAKSLFPGLAAALDAGITVRQYADPYAQIASKELGMNPNDFNLQDTKWSSPLNQIDPKTKERTAQTLDSWTSTIRSDPRYGYDSTSNARDQASQFATQLAQQFGAQA